MTPTASVAIVGLGSRGLSVLERVVTLAKRAGPAAGDVEVAVIDATCAGAGVHDAGQPDYLLLNTTCAQVSMFPDSCTVGDDVDAPGPSLYEWVTERALRISNDGFT
ncbi:MAG: FAD/NAD(P)-binding protein, partial [Actinomycetota bacterium]|nr:FAD/NAD(P)-binding protein [Actinomycetota bacterium]